MKVTGRWIKPNCSLERGLRIMDSLARSRAPLGFSELTRELDGINPASLSRTLKHLCELGFVWKDSDSGRYSCGHRCAVFSGVREPKRGEVLLARYGPIMQPLAAATDNTVILFERVQASMLNLRKVQSEVSINMQDAGTVSDNLTFPWVKLLAAYDRRVGPSLGLDEDAAAAVRAAGFYYDDLEQFDFARRLAFPLFGSDGGVVGALGMGGYLEQLNNDNVQDILRQAASALTSVDGRPRSYSLEGVRP